MDTYKDRLVCAKDVSDEFGVSAATAYRIIAKLNLELEKAGYMIIRGKCPKEYLHKRFGIGKVWLPGQTPTS